MIWWLLRRPFWQSLALRPFLVRGRIFRGQRILFPKGSELASLLLGPKQIASRLSPRQLFALNRTPGGFASTAASDPGCVKTRLFCYDSLVILRGKLMRRFVEQADRGQWTLLPECLDDFIDENNSVRVIDVFVDALDLTEMGFEGAEPAATGRPSYHPSVLLKLYIYGYLNRVQSSRRLEREAGRNVEVMWLLGRLAPDHKTIADFRKDSGLALRKVCARFVELCREMGLLATASVAIDGSKFKAVNNRDKNFTRAKVERRRAQLEESVGRYLSQLDTADRQEPTEALTMKAARLTEKLTKLKEERGSLPLTRSRCLLRLISKSH